MKHELFINKLAELESEMKLQGFWQATSPRWILEYNAFYFNKDCSFDSWVQFVFIPNCLCSMARPDILLLPQVKQRAAHWMAKPRMLQLLVELDALI